VEPTPTETAVVSASSEEHQGAGEVLGWAGATLVVNLAVFFGLGALLTDNSPIWALACLACLTFSFAGGALLLVPESTRKVGVGLLIGFVLTFSAVLVFAYVLSEALD
jgi:hypothetical protein